MYACELPQWNSQEGNFVVVGYGKTRKKAMIDAFFNLNDRNRSTCFYPDEVLKDCEINDSNQVWRWNRGDRAMGRPPKNVGG